MGFNYGNPRGHVTIQKLRLFTILKANKQQGYMLFRLSSIKSKWARVLLRAIVKLKDFPCFLCANDISLGVLIFQQPHIWMHSIWKTLLVNDKQHGEKANYANSLCMELKKLVKLEECCSTEGAKIQFTHSSMKFIEARALWHLHFARSSNGKILMAPQ